MVNPNEDTEFNDALRAHGILPPKPPSRSPSPDIPQITQAQATHTIAGIANVDQLDALLEGDNLGSDDEAIFESYRKKRMEEMKKEEKRGRFGSLLPLGREDFVREVTEGSKTKDPNDEDSEEDEDDDDEDKDDVDESSGKLDKGKGKMRGTGVVVFLFKDAVPLSQHLRPLLSRLAALHPTTKFMAIRADLCIPNYPDKNVPTLLIYRNGEMLGQLVAGQGLNGMKTTAKDLETVLIRYRAIEKPSPALRVSHTEDDDDDQDMNGEIGMVNAKSSGIRTGGGGAGTGGRRRDNDSDGSDFDI